MVYHLTMATAKGVYRVILGEILAHLVKNNILNIISLSDTLAITTNQKRPLYTVCLTIDKALTTCHLAILPSF
jgi:hypothetical protein